jgi:FecR protein
VARSTIILAAFVAFAAVLPMQVRAQAPDQQRPAPQTVQPDADEVGNVASVQGNVTATRNAVSRRLKVQDPIFRGDLLRTGATATLGITFDDETTFNLSANANITVDEFVYEEGGKSNSALFKIARGTVAFAAHQVAKTGDMKIETPTSVLGIRGTSGVVEVPDGATPGSPGEVAVKLYADEDGRVGRIELFGAGGGPRLGLLTRAASGFSLRAGPGGRFAAVALTISPQQIARDRGFVRQTFAARNIGRSMIDQRRNLRSPGQQRQPGLQRQNLQRQPGAPRQGTLPGQRAPALRQQTQPGQQRPAATPPGQPPRQQAAPGAAGQPAVRNGPNLQRNRAVRRAPATPAPRQPARAKRTGDSPPPR